MLRLSLNRSLWYGFFFPFSNVENPKDRVPKDTKLPDIAEIESLSPGEIGMDRLKHIFYDAEGNITKELQSIISATSVGLVGGFALGGMLKTKDFPQNFARENQATKWDSHFHAKRQLNNKYSLEFFKGGMSLGRKLGIFCCIFQTTSVVLYVYKGKFELLNSTIAGTVTGGFFKINMGLKGIVAGMVAGGLLGTVYGAMSKLILYITGVEINDLYEVHFQLMQKRRDILNRSATSYIDSEERRFKEMYEENRILKETAEPQDRSR